MLRISSVSPSTTDARPAIVSAAAGGACVISRLRLNGRACGGLGRFVPYPPGATAAPQDPTGAVVWQASYLPFGEVHLITGPATLEAPLPLELDRAVVAADRPIDAMSDSCFEQLSRSGEPTCPAELRSLQELAVHAGARGCASGLLIPP